MADLSVSRKTIQALLTSYFAEEKSKAKLFVIPDYQRPYSWDIEKCETLWEDVLNYHQSKSDDKYFLGTIVTCPSEDPTGIAVIDGQQRITSFFLLLRAFYKKLEIMQKDDPKDTKILGLMSQIAPCIWDVDPMSKEVEDFSKIHIKSLVATVEDNDAFHYIMEHGSVKGGDLSRYAENYTYFVEQCDDFAKNNPLDWKHLCLCILEDCIILPIGCQDLDTALVIFSTLNNRGMQLSDSDIFKAEIYKNKKGVDEKKDFTNSWKTLTDVVKKANLSIDDIFRYYTHVIRGQGKDKSKEIGLRRFYIKEHKDVLKTGNIVVDLLELAEFWNKLLKYDESICSETSKKWIHCLRNYPNEYWKYPVSVFYFKHKDDCLKDILPKFLERLMSFLLAKFIDQPTVNKIKDPIFQFCIDIADKGDANITYSINADFKQKFAKAATTKAQKSILLLNAYLVDESASLITGNIDVEHIFPQSWDTAYFNWTNEDVALFLNSFGNKIPFEKRLNIKASNGFYSRKKEHYCKSKIKEVQSLCNFSDWTKSEMIAREMEMESRLETFFSKNLNGGTQEKILEFESSNGNINAQILKDNETFVVKYIDNGKETSGHYPSYEEAKSSIDEGLLKYGVQKFLKDGYVA